MKKEIIWIELYQIFFQDNFIDKLFEKNGYTVKQYSFFPEEKKAFLTKYEYIAREFICLLKLLFKIKKIKNKKIFCLGGYYSTLLVSRIFSFMLGKQFELYIYNFYIHEASEKKIVKLILSFLLNNKKLTLIVQSPAEVSYYKSLADIDIFFVPYCSDMKKKTVKENKLEFDYIFSGGYTNRDYPLIIECARKLPFLKFIVVLSSLNTELSGMDLPENVIIYTDVSKAQFEAFVANSDIVIIPLKKDVGSSGQMFCLSAMQNKKPIIYCNISSVNYYFTEDSGIPYTINDSGSLVGSILKLIEKPDLKTELGEKAFKNYCDNFTTANRNQAIFNIINRS